MSTSFALSGTFVGAHSGAYPPRSVLLPARSSGWISIYPTLAKRASAGRLIITACESRHCSNDFSENPVRVNPLQIKHDDRFFVEKKAGAKAGTKEGAKDSDDVSTRLHNRKSEQVVEVPRRSVKPRVILIAGPTAVGKTRLSIELAKAIGGEIINADSVQVYQGLDVGAAKATLEERQGVPHHLMDLVMPTDDYTYEQFLVDARAATEQILSRGLVPIVIGGTGMYMRWFMQNKPGMTSHPFDGEDLTGEFDAEADWDYDFQAYFLYQHRADLFPRVDIRCEQMIPALLEETSWLLDLGVRPRTNTASAAIGYEEAMDLLLEARECDGVITEERFLEFLRLFIHNSKGLVKKQIAWFRKSTRSDVRKFRWIQAGRPVEQMVDELLKEYRRPAGEASEMASGEELMAASMKEGKRMKQYKPTIKIYSDADLVTQTLRWIKSTQAGLLQAVKLNADSERFPSINQLLEYNI